MQGNSDISPSTVDVAVKKLRKSCLSTFKGETNERTLHFEPRYCVQNEEDALTEIGVLSYLSRQPDYGPRLRGPSQKSSSRGFAPRSMQLAEGRPGGQRPTRVSEGRTDLVLCAFGASRAFYGF